MKPNIDMAAKQVRICFPFFVMKKSETKLTKIRLINQILDKTIPVGVDVFQARPALGYSEKSVHCQFSIIPFRSHIPSQYFHKLKRF